MDIETSITVAVILAICITPFALMHRTNKQKENNMLESLKTMAKEYHCNIDKHEFCNNYVIGLDSTKKYFFMFQQQRETAFLKAIDLTKIQKCELLKTNKSNNVLIEKIELVFTFYDKTLEKLELYNELYGELRGEFQFAKKWSIEINQIIS